MCIHLYAIYMRIAGIEWDHGNQEKCQKHGVTQEEIEAVLGHPATAVFPDVSHSQREERFWAIGKTLKGRHVFLVFTLRTRHDGVWMRPLSARYMHQKEVRHYETQITQL